MFYNLKKNILNYCFDFKQLKNYYYTNKIK